MNRNSGGVPMRIHSFIVLLLFSATLNAADNLESLISACADGEMPICDQISQMKQPAQPTSALDARAIAFAKRASDLAIEQEQIPDLGKAYPLIVRDYFSSEKISTENRNQWFRESSLETCAAHYHQRWRMENNWWPVNEREDPDWRMIYPHVLDHYFGFCVKQ